MSSVVLHLQEVRHSGQNLTQPALLLVLCLVIWLFFFFFFEETGIFIGLAVIKQYLMHKGKLAMNTLASVPDQTSVDFSGMSSRKSEFCFCFSAGTTT